MFDLHLLSVVMFVTAIAYLIWRDRANIEWHYGVLFMRRTERFKSFIGNIATRWLRGWKLISTIGIAACFVAMAYGMWLLLNMAMGVTTGIIRAPAFQLILPTPSPVGATGPGYILIPFWFWLLIIFAVLVPHELFHGIITRAENLRLKSVGLLLFAIFPGAFVEPDERQLRRAPLLSRLRVYAAGSFANFIVAGAIFLLTSYVVWPAVVAPGITLIDVNATSPAGLAGMKAGTVLYSVNGTPIKATYSEYLAGRGYFFDEIGSPPPGTTLNFSSAEQSYLVTLGMFGNTTYMGTIYTPNMRIDVVFFLSVVAPLLTMLWLFNFAIGLFNILPIPALDGGLMVQALSEKISKKYGKQLARAIGIIVLYIIFYDFLGPILMH